MCRRRKLAAGVVLSVLLPGVLLASSPGPQRPESSTITPNYKEADLGQVIQAVSEVTGKNFIVDPRVNAKVTILSATPMSPAAFYETFLAVLQVHGYVAVPAGSVIKIIPNTDARQLPSIDLPNSVNSQSDEMVTQIVTIKNGSAAQFVPVLRPLIPQQGHLAVYAPGNILIISDRASNVSRIMKIIARMEEDDDDPIDVIPLRNASAAELVRTVNQLNQGAGGADAGGASIKIVADERTNSVLISGEKSSRLRAKALILDLDTPRQGGGGDTVVRYLLYADAEKLADKLKGQASAASKAEAGPEGAAATAAASPSGGPNVDASVTIWADVPTNALIMTAPPKVMNSLMGVIDKLDVRRAQVEIEALIVEVQVNKSSNVSVQWLLDGEGAYGVTNFPGSGTGIVSIATAALEGTSSATTTTSSSSSSSSSSTSSTLSSAIPTGASLAVGSYNSTTGKGFGAVIEALRSDSSSNIISTPRIITMNNEAAEVKVTQEIPLVTGQYTSSTSSTNGTSSPFETIQREEVGSILKVTPHISDGDVIQLKIEQEDSSPGTKLTDSADISTNKRSIKTTILIEDGGIIVLGGLMKDTVSESEDRVPALGSIPLLGNLFKSRSGSRQKTNLLVFLRPKILRDQRATEATSAAKYNEMRNEQKSLNKGKITLLPGERQPSISPLPAGNTPTSSTRAPPGGPTVSTPGPQPAPRGSANSVPQSAPLNP
jgi:general secretion pathway protein D